MPSQDDIDQQVVLLAAHRRTLATLLAQRAQHTSAHAPPSVENGIREAREGITRCKATLRGLSVTTEDLLDDAESLNPISDLGVPGQLLNRAALRQLRQRALTAFYTKEWEKAEELLDQVVQSDPGDKDAQAKLGETQRQLDSWADYQMICEMRNAGNWRAVLDALADLERQHPGSSDPDGLREWAEGCSLREQIGRAQAQITDGIFMQALDLLDSIIRPQSVAPEAVVLATTLIEHSDMPLDQRMRAADIVGRVGDPRIPATPREWHGELAQRNEDFGNPAGYWCYVRPGTYSIGGWNEGEQIADIQLPAFWIARYPITVAQYAPFVAVGYSDNAQHWWTSDGWKWKAAVQPTQPRGWNTPAYDGPNLPVCGITWYEALTFTEWLTAQLSDMLPTGHVIRLPTEAEWEVAAAYDRDGKRRPYPWGETTPTPERAIYEASKLGRPAPVGCCPTGAAACGALDMCGNVMEPTMSDYRGYPERSGERVDNITSDDYEVSWRGGGWWGDKTQVSCGGRDGARPRSGFGICVGIRVVLAPQHPLVSVPKLENQRSDNEQRA